MRLFYTSTHAGWKALLVLAAALLLAAGCKKGPSNLSVGQPCTKSEQCSSGICLGQTRESEEGVCTTPCTSGSDCLEGWSCTALTQEGVMVCQEGTPNPFGL